MIIESARPRHPRQWMVALAIAALATAAVPEARAERFVNSLPFSENFDTNNYSDIVWTSQGAVHTHMPTSGFRGGAAKFTPPNAEGYSGLGQFILGMAQRPEQLNVRFLIYHGDTWVEYGPGGKLIIMNREGNRGRPMVIYGDWTTAQGTYETLGACDGTVCRYEGGDYWSDGTDSFRIAEPPLGREQEWISVELEANTTTGMIRLYIDTIDGEHSGLYIERPMDDTGPGGIWSYIDIIGGYMNHGANPQHPENYFMIDELVIDDEYIGPPDGFVSTTCRAPAATRRAK